MPAHRMQRGRMVDATDTMDAVLSAVLIPMRAMTALLGAFAVCIPLAVFASMIADQPIEQLVATAGATILAVRILR